jgi:hypothetical protein
MARFLTRDSYDGKILDPISQNHYLYASANPVMYVDLSGRMSTMELTNSMSIMGSFSGASVVVLGVATGIIFQFRANKMYDISTKTTPFLDDENPFRNWIPHAFINASEIEWPGNGYRYDKGNDNRKQALYGMPTGGYVKKSPMVSSHWTNTSFVQLSTLQFTVWERANYDLVNNRHYHIIYFSCWTWTYTSWLSGLQIMLIVPSI